MSTEADLPSRFVTLRPGLVTVLGICNILFACLILVGVLMEGFWLGIAGFIRATNDVEAGSGSGSSAFSFWGMDDPNFVRFCLVDAVTAGILNLAMLASGIGLLNLKTWAARLWAWTAWIKLVRLFLLGGIYIVVVTPSFSAHMARAALKMFPTGSFPPGRLPTVAQLTEVYSWTNLILAAGTIVLGSLYPAFSLWALGRPGVKAALVAQPFRESEPS